MRLYTFNFNDINYTKKLATFLKPFKIIIKILSKEPKRNKTNLTLTPSQTLAITPPKERIVFAVFLSTCKAL